jgi:hypothetical protein
MNLYATTIDQNPATSLKSRLANEVPASLKMALTTRAHVL